MYRWQECTKYFLGICRKTEKKVEFYDLSNPATRKMIVDMNFVASVRDTSILKK